MIKTKKDFMEKLEKELGRFGVIDKSEILADFEQHFADSADKLSEAEICEKLGDISEIAKQYAEEEIFPVIAVDETPQPQEEQKQQEEPKQQEAPPPASDYSAYQNSGIKLNLGKNINIGGLVTVLCIDIFVLSWALPTLGSLIIALLAVAFSFVVAGISIIVGGMFGFAGFVTPFSALSTVFLGIMFASLAGLLAIAGVSSVKGFIKICRMVIDWHGKMITGKPVFKNNPKGENE